MAFEYGELILKNGGRKEFWVSQAATVGRYLEARGNELTKVQVLGQTAGGLQGAAPATKAAHVLIWDPTRGGMRTPHLHFGGDMYLLNDAQWADFSKTAVAALSEKIGKAQRVSFESVMELSEVAAGM